MKILYDHQMFTRQNYGGISRYFCELMAQFSRFSDIDFLLALRVSYNENLLNRHSLDNYWSNRNNFLSGCKIIPNLQKNLHINIRKQLDYLNQPESERLLKKQDFDIFHPTYFNPYFRKYLQRKPFVLTIYDMTYERYPQLFSSRDPTPQWKKYLIEHAEKIIAISEKTKKDILAYTDIEPGRISVIYLGNPFESRDISDNSLTRFDPHSLHKPYLLFVGNRAGYKNFNFFISNVAHIIKKDRRIHIYCAGGGSFTPNELKTFKKMDIFSHVHFINVNDYIMSHLYSNARAFVFPSLYEGFGLPMLEAFSCRCPVVVSNTSALPEIGGDAACYFDPRSPESLVQALDSVIMDDKTRDRYIKWGLERVKDFSWEKTARETKKVYTEILYSR